MERIPFSGPTPDGIFNKRNRIASKSNSRRENVGYDARMLLLRHEYTSTFTSSPTLKEKWSHFDLKS